jgi:sterol carrier protein 2
MSARQPIKTFVLGVGMTEFIKPRRIREYPELGFEAGVKAMLDAQITYDDIELGIGCFCFGATCSAQRVFYQFGMTGIPILNTNNVRVQIHSLACTRAYICLKGMCYRLDRTPSRQKYD